MSSEPRSASAVRNLRNIFETKTTLDSASPGSRGRSPGALGSDKENRLRPTSKVRSSFVPVEADRMAATLEKVDSTGRRGSFGEGNEDLLELKKTMSEQHHGMEVSEGAIESAAGSTISTPLRQPAEDSEIAEQSSLASKADEPPMNPDKPTTGAEENPSAMKPADLTDANAVSAGSALPPAVEDLRPKPELAKQHLPNKADREKVKAKTNGRPVPVSTTPRTKPAANTGTSSASQAKGSPGATADKQAAKKPSRVSLTAPTAASMARSGTTSDKSPSTKPSPNSRAKPRQVTKPIEIPSHLTAPTAASRAKHDPSTAQEAPSNALRHSTTSVPKPSTTTSKPTPRSSLAAQQRPVSRDSSSGTKRAPTGGSFLDRMTRPTAASSGKTQEKTEVKSPAQTKGASSKPKVNGHASKPASKPASKVPDRTKAQAVHQPKQPTDTTKQNSDEPAVIVLENAGTVAQAVGLVEQNANGNETPLSHTHSEAATTLEATPAGMGGDETIR